MTGKAAPKAPAPRPTRDEVEARIRQVVRELEAPPRRLPELQHQHFDGDRDALRDLAALQDYAQAWRPVCPDDADLQWLAKALRLCCKAATLQEAHRWLRRAVGAAKDFEHRAAAQHGLTFADRQKQPRRKPDALQAAVIKLLKRTPTLKAAELWATLSASPPKGVEFIPRGRPPRFEWGLGPQQQCTLSAFRNRVTRAKKTMETVSNS